MDWVSLVLIVIFFILPVIQQILEQARRNHPRPQEGDDLAPEDFVPMELEAPEGSSGKAGSPMESRPPSKKEETWSDGWIDWPAPVSEEMGTPESITIPPAREEVQRPREEIRSRAREVVVLSAPPPRRAPRERIQRVRKREVRLAGEPTVDRSPPMPALSDLRSESGRVRTRMHPALEGQLSTIPQLQRAIVLTEVLGPPVGSRAPEARF